MHVVDIADSGCGSLLSLLAAIEDVMVKRIAYVDMDGPDSEIAFSIETSLSLWIRKCMLQIMSQDSTKKIQ